MLDNYSKQHSKNRHKHSRMKRNNMESVI